MVEEKSISSRAFDIFNICLLSLLALLTLYPFLYVLFASVSNPTAFMKGDFVLLWRPLGFQVESYRFVFRNRMIMTGFSNSVFYLFAGTAISMVLTFLGAYVLSRSGYLLKKPLTMLIMFTMYFSGGMVPTFLTVKSLGMLDSIWAILIPSALSTYNMIVLRTAFSGIPKSLEESARIDGANDFTILFRIMAPLSLPTIAVIGLFYAVGRWNAWFNAVIYLRDRGLYPLQLVLREILITSNADYMAQAGSSLELTALGELIKYATIIVATTPILVVYPFIQRYFVKGMMIGAVKE
ncbi:MAG: carbohydrate ABC transporter permease [Provencibacterium sp.]|jgi:putative aldouronate transport system permease protein|nr:carbohydrate ABC transporter permease [Provencibacterium sp.]